MNDVPQIVEINEIIEEQFIGENFNFSEIDNIIDKELNSRFEELKDCKVTVVIYE